MTSTSERKVTANLSLTLDGRYHGPGGPSDLAAIVPYAVTESVTTTSLASTSARPPRCWLGNAEGFLGTGRRSPQTRLPTHVIGATRDGWSTSKRWSSREPGPNCRTPTPG